MGPVDYVIRPPNGIPRVDLEEMWRFRDLFIALAWRDISVRYKQTLLGVTWALVQPLATMIIFTFVFHRVAGIQSGTDLPYPIFLYVGLLVWQYFSGVLTNASGSLVQNAQLIQKVYFPRVIIPATAATTGLVDFTVALLFLGILMFYYGVAPNLSGLAILPILMIIAFMCSMGIGLFLASLSVKYRDVRYALPFFIQLLMYVTPVIYPVKMLDGHPVLRDLLVWLNPMCNLISAARSGTIAGGPIDWSGIGGSLLVSVVYFLAGLLYFQRTEKYFADIA